MEISDKNKRNKIIIAVIFVSVVLILTAIFFWQTFKFTIIIRVFNYIVQNIFNISGVSIWLAKAIVTLSFIPLIWAITEALGFRPRFRLFKKKPVRSYKKAAYVLIILYISGFFATMYLLGKGRYFGHLKGDVTKYYAVTPEGIRFFDTPGYDPKYGIELKPATPKMVEYMERAKRGLKPMKVEVNQFTEFFDSITGEPKLWFYLGSNGEYEFFDQPGFHPVYLEELRPVGKETVLDYKRWVESENEKHAAKTEEAKRRQAIEEKRELIESAIYTLHPNSPDRIDIGLLIVEQENVISKSRQQLANKISESLINSNLVVVRDLFKPAFLSLDDLANVISGNSVILTNLGISEYVDYVFIATWGASFNNDPRLNELFSCQLSVDATILSAKTGKVLSSGVFSDAGVGIDKERAEKQAIDKIAKKLETYISSNIRK